MTTVASGTWFASFAPFPEQRVSRDPLSFPGYREKLDEAVAHTGDSESVTCGVAELGGVQVVAVVFDFDFLGASMGEATGQRIVAAIDRAAGLRLPLVTIAASGGARMQEGMLSLIQMQAISAALNRLRRAGLPQIAVACQPTTGAVWVSLVSAADVILGESEASVAFTGSRVRGTSSEALEFLAGGKLAAGALDAVAERDALPELLSTYVKVFSAALQSPPERCPVPEPLPGQIPNGGGWEAVQAATDAARPHAAEYLDHYFEERVPISGDRVQGSDPEMLCGVGLRGGQAIAYVAQAGAANTPAGFRTGVRLIGLAELLRIPVLTLIDTPGAEISAEAERAGIGTAIGQLMRAVADASVPITSLLIGEGGSGGALALASSGWLWAVPYSYFSVLAPEGAAAILYRDAGRAQEAADAMRVDSKTLVELGIARELLRPHGARRFGRQHNRLRRIVRWPRRSTPI